MSGKRKILVPGEQIAAPVDDTVTEQDNDPAPEQIAAPVQDKPLEVPRIKSSNELPSADSVDSSKITAPVLTRDGWVVPRIKE